MIFDIIVKHIVTNINAAYYKFKFKKSTKFFLQLKLM